MEKLLAYAILFREGVIDEKEYQSVLDEMFQENPEEELLVELEWETDIKNAMCLIRNHFDGKDYDTFVFGTFFLGRLKKLYEDKNMDIHEFGVRMFHIWEALPGNLQDIEPFHTLCYADDPLSWNDEVQSRKIYEKMFSYYEESAKAAN